MDVTAGSPIPPSPTPATEIAGRRIDWTPRDVLIGVLLLIGALFVPQIPLLPFGLAFGTETRGFLIPATAVTALAYVLILGIAARMTFLKYGGGWERLGFSRSTGSTFLWGGAALAGALIVSYAYGAIAQAVPALQQGCADQVPLYIRNDALVLALTAAVAVLLPPAVEEPFFRGFVFPGLARDWGIPAGIIVSGVLFGSAHLLGNPLLWKSFIQFSLIGMVFAFAYWKSGNIFSTVMAHFTFNLIGVIALAATTCQG